ncbi:hypothetical protein KTQ74_32405 [Pseudomonas chlororaphis]|uniref:hypothetical protein n=1 Tax=Pseudomonas chlororaphis TaxID=587753 RepID=UPI001E44F7B0|nr:hypothetical protein [Pseudomonas chlororaphis]MCB2256626.1 hypothetical protein [Pseudomonas chlororaphis]
MSLTQDRNTSMRDTEVLVVPVAANTLIFAGSLVVANATGLAAPGSAALNLSYLGRAEESVDNRGGAAGARQIEIRRGKAFCWTNDGTINQTHLFKTAYIVDDETVAAGDATGTRSAAGRIVGIDPHGVWVE